ncbi:uncharacterized protein [Drosophila pseudoobscura]|uniref:Uncharacterized protein n=1 Tax=Drosophila pseudoobscura pseudoobscura TaxID=46245 RepID=A0A6I8W6K8_DROPS|nr:uncharacterized protein LOC4814940 [Drosophila pseudoobscura]
MYLQKSLLLLVATVLSAHSIWARSAAPRQAYGYNMPLWQLQFPEKPPTSQDHPNEAPEPRLIGNVDVGFEDDLVADQQLQQLLLLSPGLSPAQFLQRYQPRSQSDVDGGRSWLGHFNGKNGGSSGGNSGGTTFVVITPGSIPNITNTNNNVINNTATNPAAATTGGTRIGEFIRSPIAYPASTYFRTRQDEASSLPYSSGLYGWNEAALYGSALDGRLGGGLDGGLAGGFSGLSTGFGSGVPLVPITIGNEVRYVPLNLRMFRQLASIPIRENEEREQDREREQEQERPIVEDLSVPMADDSEPEDLIETLTNGAGDTPSMAPPGFGRLGQRLRQRPIMRRKQLQSFAQNIRRVQYL